MENTVQVQPAEQPEKKKLGQFQSRFGYHPCDYPTFQRLKALYKTFWIHVRKAAAARRWTAKQPKNRHGICPVYCHAILVAKKHQRWQDWTDCPLYKLFQAARMPNPEPVDKFTTAEMDLISTLENSILDFENKEGKSTTD